MKTFVKAAALAGLFALAACGGQGDDTLGDNAADAADAAADNLDALADNTANDAVAENLEAQADALREEGKAREDAIDRSDINAQALTPAEKEAATNGL
jgi:predicted small lipoprotein YifL